MRIQRKRMRFAICGLLAGFSISSMNASALISVQAGIGLDSMKISESGDSTTLDGTELGARIQLDPLPLIPVGAGIKAWAPMLERKDDGVTGKLTGLGVDLDVSVWSPIAFFGFKPYGRLGYTVFGRQAFKHEMSADIGGQTTSIDFAYDYEVSGTQIAVGTYWSFLPLIRLMFEVGYRDHAYEPTKSSKTVTVAGMDIETTAEKFDAKTTTIMVGIEVGI